MSMEITHPGAPGHVADATDMGWTCSCGAGNEWKDGPRPRNRGIGGARRHLTAAARNNPVRQLRDVDLPEAVDESGMSVPNDDADVRAAEDAGYRPPTTTPFDPRP